MRKNNYGVYLLVAAGVALILAGALALTGCGTAPPSAFEQRFFDVTTNQVAVPQMVRPTNGAPVYWVTNIETVYDFKPGPGAEAVKAAAQAGGNMAGGYGGLAAAVVGAAFGLWGQFRSRKARAAAEVIAQGLETARTALRSSGGAALDARLKEFLAWQQDAQGVRPEVRRILAERMSADKAREAAGHIVNPGKAA